MRVWNRSHLGSWHLDDTLMGATAGIASLTVLDVLRTEARRLWRQLEDRTCSVSANLARVAVDCRQHQESDQLGRLPIRDGAEAMLHAPLD